MRRASTTFDATVRAFRDLTAEAADGSATRARVLAQAGRGPDRRAKLRRASLLVTGALLVLSSASGAWTIAGGRPRWSAPVTLGAFEPIGPRTGTGRAVRVIPSEPLDVSVETETGDAEYRSYGAAHRAHFVDDAPARALAAWNNYLAAYPAGTFAPEARYNRAVCLIRLGRLADARRALRGFERGYRHEDAQALLLWLNERTPRSP